MRKRNLEPAVRASLADTPAVFLGGPRQVGKSTLARAIAESGPAARRYLTLDDAATLAAATTDPQGFVDGLAGPVVIDEVQRAPGLFRAVKLAIDRRREPGRFLLTGSADPMLVPAFSESLAGRVEVRTLWPFSQGELAGRRDDLVDRLFGDGPIAGEAESRDRLLARAVTGGYPEVVERRDVGRRRDWLASYTAALLTRDVREIAQVENPGLLARLLTLLAARSASPLNAADLGRDAGLAYATLKRYLSLLEALHLVRWVTAWSTNATSRLVKAPKILVTDPALIAQLGGWTVERFGADPAGAGPLLESFVGMELVKQLGWSRVRATLHWVRTQIGREADFVLESDDGRLVGIEVKSSSGLGERDFAGLKKLAELAGDRFHRGVVLYAGRESLAFGQRLEAAPVSSLWSNRPRRRGA